MEYAAKILDRPTLLGFVLPAACLLLLLAAVWWMWRRERSKVAAFLIFWFVLTLAPAVIVAPMVLQHDRYLHIASFAFCALVAWAILHLANVQIGSLPINTRVVVALCVVALWTGLSWHEMGLLGLRNHAVEPRAADLPFGAEGANPTRLHLQGSRRHSAGLSPS